jgi:serine/threonine protein kinase
VLKIATTIASVAAQLHSKGIMHSDLYAHNTLIDDEGNTLFGDFGAAGFYDTTDTKTARALERLEVSAFGYLLDDLLNLCSDRESRAWLKIAELRDACLAPDVLSRPGFAYLNEELGKLRFY